MKVTMDSVIEKYVSLRDEAERLQASVKDRIKVLHANMAKLEAYIQEQAEAQGVSSFKTRHGTAFMTTTDFAGVDNWDAVLKFIRDNDAFDMLERRVSKTAVRSWIDTHKTVPPGVTYGTRLSVNVRRPAPQAD